MAVEKAPVWTFPTNPKRLGRWYGKGLADRSPVGSSMSLRSLARNHAPSPVLESTLLVLVILNAISSESPSILSACLTSSRSPSLSPDFTSYFSRCRPGVMSGVRVHTTLDSRPLSLKCSVNRFSTRPAVLSGKGKDPGAPVGPCGGSWGRSAAGPGSGSSDHSSEPSVSAGAFASRRRDAISRAAPPPSTTTAASAISAMPAPVWARVLR